MVEAQNDNIVELDRNWLNCFYSKPIKKTTRGPLVIEWFADLEDMPFAEGIIQDGPNSLNDFRKHSKYFVQLQ